MTSAITYSDSGRIDTRLRISALWVAMLFVFAYVDLFSLYRPDVRADLEVEKLSAFDINQTFLFSTTLYIVIPSLMVYLTLVMRPRTNRVANMIVAAGYGLTVIGSAVGEWNYYILGSAIETILLALVIHHAWTWPKATTRP
ncbi:hypothetical protein EV644_10286 [Kribbella orskensis]|uniref:Uncharacterized protein n=1 Tax=Kribbella orskensis TaxID=2512216 RepID=A0ABY2BRV6_9ACTN|nr:MULTISPECIES: DUF6326 family protein [Kribbella]TCN43275.1 hypothetical protein EV642_102651 [Kribbella sp. VKM Ac-2500]TCO29369.1 hypothetical protein EV644_10286 [Kribbella orskensis]